MRVCVWVFPIFIKLFPILEDSENTYYTSMKTHGYFFFRKQKAGLPRDRDFFCWRPDQEAVQLLGPIWSQDFFFVYLLKTNSWDQIGLRSFMIFMENSLDHI